MVLMHGDKFVNFYYFIYKKLKKPKFKNGELVMIKGFEYQIHMISEQPPLYRYYCCKIHYISTCGYFHEKDISKKTGLLKELE